MLFSLPTATRERRLHQLLTGIELAVPVATAVRDSLPPGHCPVVLSAVRPDGHGVFVEPCGRVAFFVEFDSGYEPQPVLLDKIARYDRHAANGGPAWPVLHPVVGAAPASAAWLGVVRSDPRARP